MSTYVFSGRVLPERASVGIPTTGWQLDIPDAGLRCELRVSIAASQILATLETENIDADLNTLKNYLESAVRSVVDAYGYISGRGYDVEITSVLDPAQAQTVFGVGVSGLEMDQDERPLSFENIVAVMSRSQYLSRALADLRLAIRSPLDTAFYCYRAMESISQSFKKEGGAVDDARSWKQLRESFRIDRSWIDLIKGPADAQRHGKMPYGSGEDRLRAMKHAWKMVDRFCSYLQGGSTPLSAKDFPTLTPT